MASSRARMLSRAMTKAVLGVPVRILFFITFMRFSLLAFRGALPSQSQLGYRPNIASARRSRISRYGYALRFKWRCRPVHAPNGLVPSGVSKLSTLHPLTVLFTTGRLAAQGDNYKGGEKGQTGAERARGPLGARIKSKRSDDRAGDYP